MLEISDLNIDVVQDSTGYPDMDNNTWVYIIQTADINDDYYGDNDGDLALEFVQGANPSYYRITVNGNEISQFIWPVNGKYSDIPNSTKHDVVRTWNMLINPIGDTEDIGEITEFDEQVEETFEDATPDMSEEQKEKIIKDYIYNEHLPAPEGEEVNQKHLDLMYKYMYVDGDTFEEAHARAEKAGEPAYLLTQETKDKLKLIPIGVKEEYKDQLDESGESDDESDTTSDDVYDVDDVDLVDTGTEISDETVTETTTEVVTETLNENTKWLLQSQDSPIIKRVLKMDYTFQQNGEVLKLIDSDFTADSGAVYFECPADMQIDLRFTTESNEYNDKIAAEIPQEYDYTGDKSRAEGDEIVKEWFGGDANVARAFRVTMNAGDRLSVDVDEEHAGIYKFRLRIDGQIYELQRGLKIDDEVFINISNPTISYTVEYDAEGNEIGRTGSIFNQEENTQLRKNWEGGFEEKWAPSILENVPWWGWLLGIGAVILGGVLIWRMTRPPASGPTPAVVVVDG